MKLLTVFCALAVPASQLLADEDAPSRWSRPVNREQTESEELVAIPLDSHVYANSQDRWADVRITDSAGAIVPYLVRKQTERQEQTVRSTWTAKHVGLKPLAEGTLEIQITLDEEDAQPDGLTLVTPLNDFEQQVNVFGGVPEQLLVSKALVFDYSRFMDVSRRSIRLPKNESRSFRIVIGALTSDQESQLLQLTRSLRGENEVNRQERTNVTRRPFRIDRIELWNEKVIERVKGNTERDWKVGGFEVAHDAEEKQTIVTVRTSREPLTSLQIETPDRNFNRRAVVEIPEEHGIRTTWRQIGEASVSRFEFRDIKEERLAVKFPEIRHETYRIVISDLDSPPLEITGIAATGHVYELVYLAAANSSQELRYGADADEPPHYDVAALRKLIKEGIDPAPAVLGPHAESDEADNGRPLRARDIFNNPVVLIVGIGALVALLGFSLFHAGRRIEQLPPDGSE